MQFGIKVPGIQGAGRMLVSRIKPMGRKSDQMNQTFPPTHEMAPLFLYKHVILETHSLVSENTRLGNKQIKSQLT